jgi:hypothetical protein
MRIRVKAYQHQIEIPGTQMLPDQVHFTPKFQVEPSQATIAGILLQRVPNLNQLLLYLAHDCDPDYVCLHNDPDMEFKSIRFCGRLLEDPIIELFPGFDGETAHLANPPLLPNLRHLIYAGADIHWALLKSPHLRNLQFLRACNLMSDTAPNEVNHAVKELSMVCRSVILQPELDRNAQIGRFLAHFPSLEKLKLQIEDLRVDYHMCQLSDLSVNEHGSYAALLQRLQTVARSLRDLYISINLEDEDEKFIIRSILPSDSFKDFASLQRLCIPYECLFGSHDTPSLPDFLPHSLVALDILHPLIAIYDWLAELPLYRRELPNVSQVTLTCSTYYGDCYELFKFTSHPHPVSSAFKSIGVELVLPCSEDDWDPEWNDYDLHALDLTAWHASFGATVSGVLLP